MSKLIEKYEGKRLTTDEVAEARTAIEAEIKALENIKYDTGKDYILFKWGTLKGWELHSEAGIALSKQYKELGSSPSAMTQEDTPEQKEIICKMIDECDGLIQSDWSGEYFTKQQAKEYIRGYK